MPKIRIPRIRDLKRKGKLSITGWSYRLALHGGFLCTSVEFFKHRIIKAGSSFWHSFGPILELLKLHILWIFSTFWIYPRLLTSHVSEQIVTGTVQDQCEHDSCFTRECQSCLSLWVACKMLLQTDAYPQLLTLRCILNHITVGIFFSSLLIDGCQDNSIVFYTREALLAAAFYSWCLLYPECKSVPSKMSDLW